MCEHQPLLLFFGLTIFPGFLCLESLLILAHVLEKLGGKYAVLV